MSEYELSVYFWSAIAGVGVLVPLVIAVTREALQAMAAHLRAYHEA